MSKKKDKTKIMAEKYVNSINEINTRYGIEKMSEDKVEQMRAEVEKVSRRFQRLSANA